jgi:hypothetical protein
LERLEGFADFGRLARVGQGGQGDYDGASKEVGGGSPAGVGGGEEDGAGDRNQDGVALVGLFAVGDGSGARGDSAEAIGESGRQAADVVEGERAGVLRGFEEFTLGGGELAERGFGGIDQRAKNGGDGGLARAGWAVEDEDRVGAGGVVGGEEPLEAGGEGGGGEAEEFGEFRQACCGRDRQR